MRGWKITEGYIHVHVEVILELTELKRLLCESHMYTGTVTAVSPVRGITATTCNAVNECARECSASSIPFHGRG